MKIRKVFLLSMVPFLCSLILLGDSALAEKGKVIESVKVRGDSSWQEWTIAFSGGEARLKATWRGKIKEWTLSFSMGEGRIEQVWPDRLSVWRYRIGNDKIDIKSANLTGWDKWSVTNMKGTTLFVKAPKAGDWENWEITGPLGKMKFSSRWKYDWKEWDIKDKMKGEDLHLKIAAIFPCILTKPIFINAMHKKGE